MIQSRYLSLSFTSRKRQRHCGQLTFNDGAFWKQFFAFYLFMLLATQMHQQAQASKLQTSVAAQLLYSASMAFRPFQEERQYEQPLRSPQEDRYQDNHLPTRVTGYGKRSLIGNFFGSTSRHHNGIWIYQNEPKERDNFFLPDNDVLKGSLLLFSAMHNCTFRLSTMAAAAMNSSLSLIPTLKIELVSEGLPLSATQNNLHNGNWRPVEGFFGVYTIPSGHVWVFVADSREIYKAPPLSKSTLHEWWNIRQITQLHLVRTFYQNSNQEKFGQYRILTRSQRLEEQRQIQLLRHAMKHHEWYYCDTEMIDNDYVKDLAGDNFNNEVKTMQNNTEGINNYQRNSSKFQQSKFVITDMTRRLQACFLEQFQRSNSSDYSNATEPLYKCTWYNISDFQESDDCNDSAGKRQFLIFPDSRFFWNQALVEPLMGFFQELQRQNLERKDHESLHAIRVLLDHVIPATSAFVGVQTNLSLSSHKKRNEMIHSISTLRYDQLLITRRSRFRTGTRFTKRGADHIGAVANYAETEQILLQYDVANINNKTSEDIVSTSKASGIPFSYNEIDRKYSRNHFPLIAICSHVQTRGSIPLRWSSPTDIKTYRPRVRIGTNPLAQARALVHHLVDQFSIYVLPKSSSNVLDKDQTKKEVASLVFVNLVDKNSDQGRLGRAFDSVLKAVLDVYGNKKCDDLPATITNVGQGSEGITLIKPLPLLSSLTPTSVRHIWFDFHAEVKSGRWNNLITLLDEVKPFLIGHDYFRAIPKDFFLNGKVEMRPEIDRLQKGIIRTNCMDCLDRTNVVQSLFGRYVLFKQFSDFKSLQISLSAKNTFRHNALTLPWQDSEVSHRMLWADNADAISRLYAGTSALKGDFTRTGKRTKRGALDDGMNSLQRYYLNNFMDADRQEGVDLLVGFQTFSGLVDDDDDEEHFDLRGRDDDQSKISIQDAARQTMLGLWTTNEDQGVRDTNYVRIKLKKKHKLSKKRLLPKLGSTISGSLPSLQWQSPTSPALDLRWLPGDLQSQLRNLAASHNDINLKNPSPMNTLKSLDARAASELPWWLVATIDSSDNENDICVSGAGGCFSGDVESANDLNSKPASVLSNSGFVLGAIVAASQWPVGLAALVLTLLGTSLSSLDGNGKKDTM